MFPGSGGAATSVKPGSTSRGGLKSSASSIARHQKVEAASVVGDTPLSLLPNSPYSRTLHQPTRFNPTDGRVQRWETDSTVMYVFNEHANSEHSGPNGEYVEGDALSCDGYVICSKDQDAQVRSYLAGIDRSVDDSSIREMFHAVEESNLGFTSYTVDESAREYREIVRRSQQKPFGQYFCPAPIIKYFTGAGDRVRSARAKSRSGSEDDDNS